MKARRFRPAEFWTRARSGEVLVLLAAVGLAVAALTAVGFLTDRIGKAVARQANEVLAADLRLRSQAPVPDEWRELAADYDLLDRRYNVFPVGSVSMATTMRCRRSRLSAIYTRCAARCAYQTICSASSAQSTVFRRRRSLGRWCAARAGWRRGRGPARYRGAAAPGLGGPDVPAGPVDWFRVAGADGHDEYRGHRCERT